MSAVPRLSVFVVLLVPFGGCSDASLSSEEKTVPGPRAPSAAAEDALPVADLSARGAEPAGPASNALFWPRFRGPRGDGVSTDTGLMKEWPDGGPKLAWSTAGIGHGFSSVAVAGGMIYTDGNIEEKTVITALDMEGSVRWQEENGPAWTGSTPGTRGTPTIDGDRLYHESPLGEIAALDAATGERIWGLNILERFGAKNIGWALSESLLVDGDNLICCPGGPQASVVALDKRTGETVWKAESVGENASYASPMLAEFQGLRMILAMNAKALIGVNADTGELLFRYEHLTKYDVNATDPIYHDGRVFITSGYGAGGEMVQLTVDGGKVGAERLWESKDLDNHHGGVILVDGYLYGSDFRKNWVCLDWETGKRMYCEAGVGKGSLTYAEGMLYTFSENRRMGLVEATPAGHTVTSQFELPSGGSGKSWAYPVVCGGRLYLRHSDRLFAYRIRAGS